jgi:O-antigen biosynthesis protein
MMERANSEIGRRYRQFRDLWRTEGLSGITDRARRVAAEWLTPKNGNMPVLLTDVLAADLSRPLQVTVPKATYGKTIINWVTIPAGPKSGGHTTLFRIIRYLEAHGYVNRVYFYNVYRGDLHY